MCWLLGPSVAQCHLAIVVTLTAGVREWVSEQGRNNFLDDGCFPAGVKGRGQTSFINMMLWILYLPLVQEWWLWLLWSRTDQVNIENRSFFLECFLRYAGAPVRGLQIPC